MPSAPRRSAHKRKLPSDFTPGRFTVICGRGKLCSASAGNEYLRSVMRVLLTPYSMAKNKTEKSSIVSSIMKHIRYTSPLGIFVKQEKGGAWWEVEDSYAREKIGCIFRDMLHTQYRSSNKAKHARKRGYGYSTTATTTPTKKSSDKKKKNWRLVNLLAGEQPKQTEVLSCSPLLPTDNKTPAPVQNNEGLSTGSNPKSVKPDELREDAFIESLEPISLKEIISLPSYHPLDAIDVTALGNSNKSQEYIPSPSSSSAALVECFDQQAMSSNTTPQDCKSSSTPENFRQCFFMQQKPRSSSQQLFTTGQSLLREAVGIVEIEDSYGDDNDDVVVDLPNDLADIFSLA